MKVRGNTVGTTLNPNKLKDKLSPTITITDIYGGHRVTITDKNGTKSFDIMDAKVSVDGFPIAMGTGEDSIIMGDLTGNQANSHFGHAFGENCINAGGAGGMASGFGAYQKGTAAHSLGRGTITWATGQLACGRWNEKDTDALFLCGDGSSDDDRCTAFAVYGDRIMLDDVTLTSEQITKLTSLLDNVYDGSVSVS